MKTPLLTSGHKPTMAFMRVSISTSKRLLIVYYLLTLHIVAVYLVFDKVFERYALTLRTEVEEMGATPKVTDSPGQAPSTSPAPEQSSANTNRPHEVPVPSGSGYIIPVAGVGLQSLIDSFNDERSNGRTHEAIDIAAPEGTPVIAVANGKIVKFFDSEAGGITIYQLSDDEQFVYYYAHLQRRADGLQEGETVMQGRTIGYVGDTGNAAPGNYHLHFSVMSVTDPKRYWEGQYIDPLPLFAR